MCLSVTMLTPLLLPYCECLSLISMHGSPRLFYSISSSMLLLRFTDECLSIKFYCEGRDKYLRFPVVSSKSSSLEVSISVASRSLCITLWLLSALLRPWSFLTEKRLLRWSASRIEIGRKLPIEGARRYDTIKTRSIWWYVKFKAINCTPKSKSAHSIVVNEKKKSIKDTLHVCFSSSSAACSLINLCILHVK